MKKDYLKFIIIDYVRIKIYLATYIYLVDML